MSAEVEQPQDSVEESQQPSEEPQQEGDHPKEQRPRVQQQGPTEEEQAFIQQVANDFEVALKPVIEKYRASMNDVAIVINWTPDNRQRPFPKLLVQTVRNPPVDIVLQAMEIHDLMNLSGSHIINQMLTRVLQEHMSLSAEVQRLGRGGQSFAPPPPPAEGNAPLDN